MPNAHDYEDIYTELGIDVNKLGCVMKDIVPMSPVFIMDTILALGDDAYVTNDEDKFWIDGLAIKSNPHITLLYGLLEPAEHYAEHIETLLDGLPIPSLHVESIGHFDSPHEDESYYCIVAHILRSPELLEAHARLQLLPHIDTYSEFKPHFTLAYIKKDEAVLERMKLFFAEHLVGQDLETEPGINLGR